MPYAMIRSPGFAGRLLSPNARRYYRTSARTRERGGREKRKTPWRTSFLIEYSSDRTMQRMLNMGYFAVRTERWKYIQYTELEGSDELYDLRSDPYEMKNLIAEPSSHGILESLRADLQHLKQ
jgi:arylsulfatase A-like enzyme